MLDAARVEAYTGALPSVHAVKRPQGQMVHLMN